MRFSEATFTFSGYTCLQQLHVLGGSAWPCWIGVQVGGHIPGSGGRHCLCGAGVLQRPNQNDTDLCFPQKAFCTLAKKENMKINSEGKRLIRVTNS